MEITSSNIFLINELHLFYFNFYRNLQVQKKTLEINAIAIPKIDICRNEISN